MEFLSARMPIPPEVDPSEEKALIEKFYSNMIDRAIGYGELRKENKELHKKLEKARKKEKKWKNKYLELYNYVKKMEDTTSVPTDPMWERVKLGFGLPLIESNKK